MKKYDPDKSFGEEFTDKTMTGRALKAGMVAAGIAPRAQRVNRKGKGDREGVGMSDVRAKYGKGPRK